MKALTKIAAGSVGIFALVGAAAPAAAQYYPGYGYGGGDVLGQIISQVLGGGGVYGNYGSYGYNPQRERYLVEQCARATENRIQRSYGYAGYGGYNQGYGGYGGYNQGYGGYNQGYGGARIVSITRVDRRNNGGVKIWGVATSGQGYGGGYGQSYGGYGGYGGYNATAGADLRFDCTINYRGRVTDIDISRNRYGYRGY